MKKTILIISIILLTITTIKAQKNILLGIKGGYNLSNITSEYYAENNRKTGFYLGVLTEIPLGTKFSIQSEILYATYGADVFIINYGGGPTETEFSLDYLQIPVLGKFYIFKNLSIEIGPSFNFLVNDRGYRPGLSNVVDRNGNIINQKGIDPYGSNFELSGLVGISYKLSKTLLGSARFTKGLSNAFNPPSRTLGKEKNNAFQFGIGFIF